ncbi:hypothetical protein ERJ75_001077000 [Trypanosoma vivax]|nr:hypothetical protein ERJ75_001077000 [Trypanosoma vivax]
MSDALPLTGHTTEANRECRTGRSWLAHHTPCVDTPASSNRERLRDAAAVARHEKQAQLRRDPACTSLPTWTITLGGRCDSRRWQSAGVRGSNQARGNIFEDPYPGRKAAAARSISAVLAPGRQHGVTTLRQRHASAQFFAADSFAPAPVVPGNRRLERARNGTNFRPCMIEARGTLSTCRPVGGQAKRISSRTLQSRV